MEDIRIDVAGIIKNARNERGYSLRKLGNITGISHSFLGDIEAGRSRPSYEKLVKIVEALDIPLDNIFLPRKYKNSEQNKTA